MAASDAMFRPTVRPASGPGKLQASLRCHRSIRRTKASASLLFPWPCTITRRIDEQAIELVLPCLSIGHGWQEYIRSIFEALKRAAIDVRVDDHCGLHVHVSVGHKKGWALERAKTVCVRWFEDEEEFNAKVDKARADTSWCLSNSEAKGFEGCDNNLNLYIAAIKSCPINRRRVNRPSLH